MNTIISKLKRKLLKEKYSSDCLCSSFLERLHCKLFAKKCYKMENELFYLIYRNSYVNFLEHFDSSLKINITANSELLPSSISTQKINFKHDHDLNSSKLMHTSVIHKVNSESGLKNIVYKNKSPLKREKVVQNNNTIDTSPKIISLELKRHSTSILECKRKLQIQNEIAKDFNSHKTASFNEHQLNNKIQHESFTKTNNSKRMPDIVISTIQPENNFFVERCNVKEKIQFFNQIANKTQKSYSISKNRSKRLARIPSLTKRKLPDKNIINTSNTMPKTKKENNTKSSKIVRNSVKMFENNKINDIRVPSPSVPKDIPNTSNLVKLRIAEFESFVNKSIRVTEL